jgi:hypothetical protein
MIAMAAAVMLVIMMITIVTVSMIRTVTTRVATIAPLATSPAGHSRFLGGCQHPNCSGGSPLAMENCIFTGAFPIKNLIYSRISWQILASSFQPQLNSH